MAAKKMADDPRRLERVKIATAMRLQGLPIKQVATLLHATERTVQRYQTYAAKHGMIEAVRKDLADRLLPKSADLYEKLLDTPVEELQASAKGWKLKLDAAHQLAGGLGAFRKESNSMSQSLKGTVDLDHYIKMRALSNDLAGGAKIRLVDGDVIDVEPTPVIEAGATSEEGVASESMRGQLQGAVELPIEGDGIQGELFSHDGLPAREGLAGEDAGGGDSGRPAGVGGVERQAGDPGRADVDERGEVGDSESEEVGATPATPAKTA